LKIVLGQLNAPATRAMIRGVIRAHSVGTPNADESSVLVGKHRYELARSYTIWAPNDHNGVGLCWKVLSHGHGVAD